MSQSIYLYTKVPFRELEGLIEDFQKNFDELLEDSFSDGELSSFEKWLDAIASVHPQPLLSELSFDDFFPDPGREEEQRMFFTHCRSSLGLENLPYLESNPFQVTYIYELLKLFDEVLIDRGGVHELCFKKDYLESLKNFKSIEALALSKVAKVIEVKTDRPVDPIDFLIKDVYRELDRLGETLPGPEELSPKVLKIYEAVKRERLNSSQLLRIGLNPKDLDDGLERLKFWLRKF